MKKSKINNFHFWNKKESNRPLKIGNNFFLLLTIFIFFSCKKFVTVNPPVTGLSSTSVYENDKTASAVLTGIYSNMMSGSTKMSSGQLSIGYLTGLSSDELKNYSTNSTIAAYYLNNLDANVVGSIFFGELYQQIYVTNAAIEGLNNSTSLTPGVKQQLLGEAKFMRAFFYFYTVNLYGDAPLLISSNYKENSLAAKTSKDEIYKQIITDLKDAENLLSVNYVNALGSSTNERIRPNKSAASALLARAFLYTSDWANAQIKSSSVINNSTFALTSLDKTFLRANLGNNEAIWQLQSVFPNTNTWDGYFYVLTSAPGTGVFNVALSDNLIKSFDSTDSRFLNWINKFSFGGTTYYYPNKYKIGVIDPSIQITEYTTVLRLAEQYLIRAEAEANGAGGGIAAAIADLNIIRNRAGLSNYTGPSDKTSILKAILHERQLELFTEWGHRWFDLKRTGNIDQIMQVVAPQKGTTWSSYMQFFPFPIYDLTYNPNLVQNSGY